MTRRSSWPSIRDERIDEGPERRIRLPPEELQADLSYHQEYGDLNFHYVLAQRCGSRRLAQLLCRDLYSLMRLFRFRTGHAPGRPLRAFVDHESILQAMRHRDGELAELLMRRHVAAAGAQLQASIDETEVEVSTRRSP